MKIKIQLFFLLIIFISCSYSNSVSLISIPGGEFLRGKKDGINNPLQNITVHSFKISKYEITVELFRKYLREKDPSSELLNDDDLLSLFNPPRNYKTPNDWPIYQVTFYQAIEFCNWLSEKDGYDPVYIITYNKKNDVNVIWNKTKNGYRLPTEAEWEFAASGGGKYSISSLNLEKFAWFSLNSGKLIHSVGQKKPNLYGLFDMLGNVSEWCWDLYDINYYIRGDTKNPTGPIKGYNPTPSYESGGASEIDRVVRGGDIKSPNADTYTRDGFHPELTRLVLIGFRIAQNLK